MKLPTTPLLLASIAFSSPLLAAPVDTDPNSHAHSPAMARSKLGSPTIRNGSGARRAIPRYRRREASGPPSTTFAPSASGLSGLGFNLPEPLVQVIGSVADDVVTIITHPDRIPKAVPIMVSGVTDSIGDVTPTVGSIKSTLDSGVLDDLDLDLTPKPAASLIVSTVPLQSATTLDMLNLEHNLEPQSKRSHKSTSSLASMATTSHYTNPNGVPPKHHYDPYLDAAPFSIIPENLKRPGMVYAEGLDPVGAAPLLGDNVVAQTTVPASSTTLSSPTSLSTASAAPTNVSQ